MDRFPLMIICIFAHLTCHAQDAAKIFVQKDNGLYLVEHNRSYLVNDKIVTVKLKEKQETPNFKVVRSNKLGYIDIAVPNGVDIQKYVKDLESTGFYESIDYNCYGTYCVVPNDTYVANQWYLEDTNCFEAMDITNGSPNIKIAILDTGVDWTHYDLGYGNDNYNNIEESLGWNYVSNTNNVITSNAHGTLVAGVIGAKTNNNYGISGIAGGNNSSGVKIIPLCVGVDSPDGSILDDAIIDAVDLGAKVIQLSLSVNQTTSIDNALNYAYNNGVSIVCASGNNSSSAISYPASHENVLAIGASNAGHYRTSFSNYGNGLDLVAPGTNIKSTTLNNGYDSVDGTSFAAPQVSGIIGLILSVSPSSTPSEIYRILRSTATKISNYAYNGLGWNSEVGYGLVDAYSAVSAVAHRIMGNDVICNTASYYVENISDDISVVWELANSYYANSSDLFKPNYPTTGKCTIVRDSSVVLNDTLVAKLYYNGTLFKTLKKAVKTMTTFTCQLENEGCSGIVPGYATSGNRVEVPTNCKIRLVSDKLKHMTVSHLGATPTYWQVNQTAGTVTFQLPLSLSYQAIVINGHSTEDCSNFSITFYNGIPPDPIVLDDEYSLRVTKLGTNLTVMLQSVGGIITPLSQGELNAIGDDFQWTLRINKVSTGQQVYNQSVTGSTKVVSTSGWASGYYIIQAIVDGDVVATQTVSI